MESLDITPQWRARPFERGNRVGAERAQTREEPSVRHTPASRWRPAHGQYAMRRPLFTSEHGASSSIKTQACTRTEKVNDTDISRNKDNQHLSDTIPTHRLGRLGFKDPVTPLLSRLELSSSPTVPDLSLHAEELSSDCPSSPRRLSSSAREISASQSPYNVPPSSQRLSSSVLEVQRPNPPLRPPLSSTVLNPTYRPRWGLSLASGQAPGRLGTQRETSLGSSDDLSKSAHQQDFWTCAVPKGLPPSPDRRSADWDPNAEYEDLLDYTYPLKARQGVSTLLNRSSPLKHPPAGPDLQDSGIGLDRTCSSSNSLSPLCLTATDACNWRAPSAGQRSPDCLDGDHTLWSLDSEDAGIRERCGRQRSPPTSPLHCSIPTLTSFLPTSWRVGAEVDEEFWPLPEQLEELQLLSRQVREVAAQLSRPLPLGQRSPSPREAFVSPPLTLPQGEKPEAEEGHQTDYVTSRRLSPKETDVVDFSGRSPPGSQKTGREGEGDSLLQHLQIFCSHLEKLIRQLYADAQRTEQLPVPTAAVHNAKTWLDECQTFQWDLSSHQPATPSVLSTGNLLLRCINSVSPFLRDTLLLIEKRSGLLPPPPPSLVDHLLQSTLVPHDLQEDPGLVAVHTSS